MTPTLATSFPGAGSSEIAGVACESEERKPRPPAFPRHAGDAPVRGRWRGSIVSHPGGACLSFFRGWVFLLSLTFYMPPFFIWCWGCWNTEKSRGWAIVFSTLPCASQ
jgi:hypothetical protein